MLLQSSHLLKLKIKMIIPIGIVMILLLTIPADPVLAQDLPPGVEPEIVYVTPEYSCGNTTIADTIEVWNVGAAGGPAYAAITYPCHGCAGEREVIKLDQCTGTFTGGPNGTATISICHGDSCLETTIQFVNGEYVTLETGNQFPVQNPEAFAAWFAEPITAEYIYTTYGISVENTSADSVYGEKSWSPQELILLNEVLKELPKGLLNQMAISRIIRSKHNVDKNGIPNDTLGFYAPCGSPKEKDCSPQAATIRIFDEAHSPLDFSDDPNGIIQFKATILHELTHALQYKKDTYSIYRNPYDSPIMQNFMDATRPITNIDDPGFEGNNGWKFGHPANSPPPRWILHADQANGPPTNYGGTNPIEDMSESVMMYVYEPEKLKNSSPARYNFIRDIVFEGVEYDNGTQKKP